MLLVASGLMIRTFQAMRDVNPGFVRPEEVITLRVSIPDSIVADDEQAIRTHEQIVRKLEQIPGVRSVGVSNSITMDGFDSNDPIFVEDFPPAADKIPPLRRFKFTAQNYFQTMGNPIIAGREMTWADVYSHASVAIVSENFAREYWKEPAAAIGKRIRQTPSNPWRTIIGVVGNERDNGISSPATSIVYWPLLIDNFWDDKVFAQRNVAFALRTERAESPTLLKEIQQAVWSVNGNLPLANVRTLRPDSLRVDGADVVRPRDARLSRQPSRSSWVSSASTASSPTWRSSGRKRLASAWRLAPPAATSARFSCATASSSRASASSAAWSRRRVLTRTMSALLFGVSAYDPLTYGAVALALGGTAVIASYLPARRASKVDPAEALRWEA